MHGWVAQYRTIPCFFNSIPFKFSVHTCQISVIQICSLIHPTMMDFQTPWQACVWAVRWNPIVWPSTTRVFGAWPPFVACALSSIPGAVARGAITLSRFVALGSCCPGTLLRATETSVTVTWRCTLCPISRIRGRSRRRGYCVRNEVRRRTAGWIPCMLASLRSSRIARQ